MIPKFPRILVYSLLVGGCLALIPPVVFARMRATPSPNRPIHIFYDMDFQSKYKPQEPNPLFADGRAMRAPVPGTVARGESYADSHLFEGVVDGQWAATLPEGIQMDAATLARGQQRFNIYCSACHGYAGYGDGAVNQRAMELVANATGPVNGTQWVAAKSLHDETTRHQPMGQLFNTITHGIRNMAGYGAQIPTQDRWAIAAYVKALQLSQDAASAGAKVAGAAE
jgi:mono/diheme cytochrome c family protein